MSTYQPRGLKAIYHKTRRILAKNWFQHYKPFVVAVTGSQGKTNTLHILEKLFPLALRTDTNLDTIYNVPVTTLKLRSRHKLALYELGIDHQGEMDRHLEIVRPKISIITGISPVHSDEEHLGSLQNVILEKRKLIECLSAQDTAILNYDDVNVRAMAPFTKARVFFYGSGPEAEEHCRVWTDVNIGSFPWEHVKITPAGTTATIYFHDYGVGIQTGLIGAHHISNIMAAFLTYHTIMTQFPAVAETPGLEKTNDPMIGIINYFADVVNQLQPIPGRLSYDKGPMGCNILNDSLRANPESAKVGLLTLEAMFGEQNGQVIPYPGKKIAVLGEMGELGELSVPKHQELGRLAAQINCDLLIGIGPLQKETITEATQAGLPEEKTVWVPDVSSAAAKLKEVIKPGDLIYLKGSLLRHMERIIMLLGGEKVGCNVISCPFYNNCSQCRYVKTGY